MLYDMVDILKVFLDELLDSWVVGYVFLCTIGKEISLCWSSDRYVINIRHCNIRYLWLKYECDIVVKYQD